jgi:hypothetical protein
MRFDHLPRLICLSTILLWICLTETRLLAQTQSNPDASDSSTNGMWTATTEQSLPGSANPTQTSQTHTEADGRSVDSQSLQRIGPDGRYVPYLDTEKETIKVNATTVRTVERTFGRDSDGRKTLVQVTEEEQRTLAGGEVRVMRTTSNPDANGNLQIVQRKMQDTKQIGPDVQETKTTVLLPVTDGGLAPSMQTDERQTKTNDHDVQFRKSTQIPDGNGGWQVSEVREGTIKDDGKNRTTEERVFRPDTDGHLAVVEKTVRNESETAPGEKRETEDTYSTQTPGSAGDGSLHLNQRVTTVQHKRDDGGQSTEKQVEQRNPADPDHGLRVTQKTIDVVRPGLDGATKETQTIHSLDSNGNLGVVSVDTRKQDNSAIQVEIAPVKAH